MINNMDQTEVSIGVFNKAVQKNRACKHMEQSMGQRVCKLFWLRMDTAQDTLIYCSSCIRNSKSPTTRKIKARFP